MADIVFVSVILAFFALCVIYVRWCDRIIGADEASSSPAATAAPQGPALADIAHAPKDVAA